MGIRDLLEHWKLVEFDFAHILSVDLTENLWRPWRWFTVRVEGLLSHPHSQLRAYFADQEEPNGQRGAD